MEIKHQLFESMLHEKGMTKRAFSQYAKIPYYTVAGWKKSGKVPPYVMVLLTSMPTSKTVNAQQLIDIGVPRAVFWNNDLKKSIPNDIFIVSTLRRSYNDVIISKFITFFGEETVLAALIKHKNKLSDPFIHSVIEQMHTSLASA
ncbi:MAG: Unknown protein [uncultured Sulfurovum sp.]|uniref:Uncharacterized protein n=1 Tax=uncultured Sulfurovum sp. TaxID=269237 RepID=A0A6S6UA82_9BACT|nr:MAG: Unknown protein [uncultured Sulfurovum sp.]